MPSCGSKFHLSNIGSLFLFHIILSVYSFDGFELSQALSIGDHRPEIALDMVILLCCTLHEKGFLS